MVYLDERENNTLNSIVEGIYLGDKFSDRLGNSNILVNPDHVHYISGKTIIINQPEYPEENFNILRENGCKIISRIKLSYSGYNFQPYIVHPEFGIMWNGMTIDVSGIDINNLLSYLENCIIFNSPHELYFPKLIGLDESLLIDSEDNLTSLGWLMHQVGINVSSSSLFQDMDLLKTKKMLL